MFAEVPVNGNDLFAQFESKKSRAKQIVALWAKFDRDYYKTIQPKVEFKYNRVKQVIEFKIEYPVNMSMYVRNARALSKKLEDLGIGETGALDLTICKKGGDKLFDFRIPSDGKILDFYRAERDKYQYRLVINCKDRAGEVLQKVTLDLPEDVCPKKWRNTFSTYNPSTTRTYTKTAEFDIPEDLEKVASIETFIEERVEK